MDYKVGDKVIIAVKESSLIPEVRCLLGRVLTISHVDAPARKYYIKEDEGKWRWSARHFKRAVLEDKPLDVKKELNIKQLLD